MPCSPWFVHWLSARWIYCNSLLDGISGQLQDRLQSFLNVAARLVFSARRPERITIASLVESSGCAFWPTAAAAFKERRSLRAFSWHLSSALDVVCELTQPCWRYRPPDVQHSVTVPSQWLRHVRGTTCRHLSGMHRRWRRSVTSWRL